MNFLPILIFGAGIVTCVYSNVISAAGDGDNLCPPPENIAPCTCYKDPNSQVLTARCANFTDAYELKAIFKRNPQWEIEEVWIDKSVLRFLPADMMKEAHFDSLYVTSTSLVTLFDTPTVTTPELNLYLTDVKLQRGFEWPSIANATLLSLKIKNMRMKSLGQEFKDNIPKVLQFLWLENTGLASIRNQPFVNLPQLKFLVMKKGNLKKLSRDMFPKPWNVNHLDLSYQKITAFPDDFLVDMPELSTFHIEGNQLTTISEKVFTNYRTIYYFKGNPINCNCNIKWITEKIRPEDLNGECDKPVSLKGTELRSLKPTSFGYCH